MVEMMLYLMQYFINWSIFLHSTRIGNNTIRAKLATSCRDWNVCCLCLLMKELICSLWHNTIVLIKYINIWCYLVSQCRQHSRKHPYIINTKKQFYIRELHNYFFKQWIECMIYEKIISCRRIELCTSL